MKAAGFIPKRRRFACLNRPLEIPADLSRRAASEATIASVRQDIGTGLESEPAFFRADISLDISAQTGNPALWTDLKRYMRQENLWDFEEAFAEQYVRNPTSGELVKRTRHRARRFRLLLILGHHRHRYKTGEGEPLDPSVLGLQRGHFRRVQIAFRIDGQVVQGTKLSRS